MYQPTSGMLKLPLMKKRSEINIYETEAKYVVPMLSRNKSMEMGSDTTFS